MTTQPAADFRLLELQKTLYASRNPTRRWLHTSRRDWILDAISRVKTAEMTHVLEIGPGSGVYLPKLAAMFQNVVAADIEPSFLHQARGLAQQHPNLEIVADDITDSSFPSQSFDLVLCSEVIEHIDDSPAALRQIARILKPRGTLILSTPQKYSFLEMTAKVALLPGIIEFVRLVYREPILETGHINLLTARAAQRQLSDAGFLLREAHFGGLYIPVIAELLGDPGLRCAVLGERMLKRISLTASLWTQYYVATRAS